MCGIVAAIAAKNNNITPILLEGLTRLEYRGYDSAGIAVLKGHDILTAKTTQKVVTLKNDIQAQQFQSNIGIAHTRWATHGVPNEVNAHPHIAGNRIAIVHNGIIENYDSLKNQLEQQGHKFYSETDTEVIAVKILSEINNGNSLIKAVQNTVLNLEGAFALAIMDRTMPEQIIAVKYGSPLVLANNRDSNYIASDVLALQQIAEQFIYLKDGDIATLTADKITLYDATGTNISLDSREIAKNNLEYDAADKGTYQHYMHKEIFEQPEALKNSLASNFTVAAINTLTKIQAVQIVACGTSYHAGLVAKYWLESIAKVPCNVEIASEYKYREHIIGSNTLLVLISQSGETADLLAALNKDETKQYLSTLAICNVATSSLVQQTDFTLLTHAGVEIGVASTKAFTAQLSSLLTLTHTIVGQQNSNELTKIGKLLPELASEILQLEPEIKELAKYFLECSSTLFLGRGSMLPIAQEGALKLKELSYIHAEAYPAGELKHGALALVDYKMPVVVLAPNNNLIAKLLSNIQEIKARDGELFVFTSANCNITPEHRVHAVILPEVPEILAPILYTIPLQLLSYHVANLKGNNVDQPRNLAKSVTVE